MNVGVCSCERLKSLFQLPGASNLKELETIDMQKCRDLDEFFVGLEGRGNGEQTNDQINFPNLIVLNLKDLSSLVAIRRNNYDMNFPQLITLKLQKLPQLISLIYPNSSAPKTGSSILHLVGPQATLTLQVKYFGELQYMVVDGCKTICQNFLAFHNLIELQIESYSTLRFVFPLSIVKGLMKLESMYISKCSWMKDIILYEGGGDGEVTNKLVFQVKLLHLKDLGYLATICPAACSVDCPLLKTLVLTGCRNMTFGTKRSGQTHFFTEKETLQKADEIFGTKNKGPIHYIGRIDQS
ncbi:uncharacterized protein LOC133737674 [Rosa rugosa]|uniref:uncharacterized protein LOC133737674 n=1 Tax=Rosa rugosa TaxID=74645 RepID=UPI002B4022A9|nr:uncharacterized protein LOC133737674 [Rosa rugosa]